jgi:hypothetical protein
MGAPSDYRQNRKQISADGRVMESNMTGIILIVVVLVWVIAAIAMGIMFTSKFKPVWFRGLAALLLIAILIPLPVVDEIIGERQFKALCDKYAVQIIDEKNAQNRKVLSVGLGKDWYATNTILKIRIQPWIYQDVETGKALVSYHTVEPEGGWLIRSLGISETKSPLLIPRVCYPPDERVFIKKFNITIIDK